MSFHTKNPLIRDSFTFGCNKGGVGKSTLIFQFAPAFAQSNPDVNVLVLDLTLTGNTSTMIITHDQMLAVKDQCQRADLRVRASDMLESLRDFAVHAKNRSSWLPNRAWFSKNKFDFADHALRVCEHASSSPDNLFLSVGSYDIRQAVEYDNWSDMVEAWQRTGRSEVDPDSKPWVIFFDTDQNVASPHAQFALRVSRKLVVPVGLSEMDFERCFEQDEIEPGVFHMLRLLHEEASKSGRSDPPCRLHQLIFNRVNKRTNDEVESGGISSPFTPTKEDLAQCGSLADRLYELVLNSPETARLLFHELDETFEEHGHTAGAFKRRYFTAFQNGASNPFNFSQRHGAPFACIADEGTGDSSVVRLPNGTASTFNWGTLRTLRENTTRVLAKLML